jgi:hypothetical protein
MSASDQLRHSISTSSLLLHPPTRQAGIVIDGRVDKTNQQTHAPSFSQRGESAFTMGAQVLPSHPHPPLRRRTYSEFNVNPFHVDNSGAAQSSMALQQQQEQLYQQAQHEWQRNQLYQEQQQAQSKLIDDLTSYSQLHMHPSLASQHVSTSSNGASSSGPMLSSSNQTLLDQTMLSYDLTDFPAQQEVQLRQAHQTSNTPLTTQEFNQLLMNNSYFSAPPSSSPSPSPTTFQNQHDQNSWMSSQQRPPHSSSSSSSSLLFNTSSLYSTPLFSPIDALPPATQTDASLANASGTSSPLHTLLGATVPYSSNSSNSSMTSSMEETPGVSTMQPASANDSFRNRSLDSREGIPACDFCRKRKVKVSQRRNEGRDIRY